MKAWRFRRYGSPDVLQFVETARPVPKADEVLVRVHAAAANPLDWHRLRADPVLVQASLGNDAGLVGVADQARLAFA